MFPLGIFSGNGSGNVKPSVFSSARQNLRLFVSQAPLILSTAVSPGPRYSRRRGEISVTPTMKSRMPYAALVPWLMNKYWSSFSHWNSQVWRSKYLDICAWASAVLSRASFARSSAASARFAAAREALEEMMAQVNDPVDTSNAAKDIQFPASMFGVYRFGLVGVGW